jgi:hypothetical protein
LSQKSSSKLEYVADTIKLYVASGDTNTTIVKKLNGAFGLKTSEAAIRRFRIRHNLPIPGVEKASTKIDGDTATAATEPVASAPVLDDPDAMLRERGLDPAEWYIDSVTVNEWDGPQEGGNIVTYHQAKFTAKRLNPVRVHPPRTDGWTRPKTAYAHHADMGPRVHKRIVVVGDQQAPYHDPNLHRLFLRWLEFNKPDQGVSLGDLYDFPDISRHPDDPENDASVNECLQTGYDILRGYVDASPETYWRKLIGNHDERIRNLLLKMKDTKPLYGLKRPDTPEEKGELVLELSHLARLDELGVEVVWPNGGYKLGQLVLSDKLAVRHGWLASKGSGSSALNSLRHLGYSIIVGHTHRQSVVHETKHEIYGETRTLTGVEAGCMCRVKQEMDESGRVWPSYAPNPDWQQGFVTVDIWEDGSFNIDTAKYVNGKLLYRNQCYS